MLNNNQSVYARSQRYQILYIACGRTLCEYFLFRLLALIPTRNHGSGTDRKCLRSNKFLYVFSFDLFVSSLYMVFVSHFCHVTGICPHSVRELGVTLTDDINQPNGNAVPFPKCLQSHDGVGECFPNCLHRLVRSLPAQTNVAAVYLNPAPHSPLRICRKLRSH